MKNIISASVLLLITNSHTSNAHQAYYNQDDYDQYQFVYTDLDNESGAVSGVY